MTRAAPDDCPVPATSEPVHLATDLVGPAGTARILLAGQTYVLRITRAGKLILTK